MSNPVPFVATSAWTWVAQVAVIVGIAVFAVLALTLIWALNRKLLGRRAKQAVDTTNYAQLFGGISLVVFGAVMVVVFQKNGVSTTAGAVGVTVSSTVIGAGAALLPGATGSSARGQAASPQGGGQNPPNPVQPPTPGVPNSVPAPNPGQQSPPANPNPSPSPPQSLLPNIDAN